MNEKIWNYVLPRGKLLEILLLSTLIVFIITIQLGLNKVQYDDAFITFRYARNLASGRGFVYNPGERVLGTSSSLFTFFLATISKVLHPSRIPEISRVSGAVFDAIGAMILFQIANRITKEFWISFLIVLVYLVHPMRLDFISGGLETSLYILLLLLLFFSLLQKEQPIWSAVVAALALMTRPDAIIAVGIFIVAAFFKNRKRTLQLSLIFSIFIIPWLLWSTLYFGSPIPQTVIAKRISYSTQGLQAVYFLSTFLGTGTMNIIAPIWMIIAGILCCVLLFILGIRRFYQVDLFFLTFPAFLVLYVFIASILNLPMWFGWYYLPLLPPLILTLVAGSALATKGDIPRRAALITLNLILLIAVPYYIYIRYPYWDSSRVREQTFLETCEALDGYIDHVDSVLAPDIGVIGWCFENSKVLDPIGLVWPIALDYIDQYEEGQHVSIQLVNDWTPDLIIGMDYFFDPYLFTSNDFQRLYQEVWNKELTLSGSLHTIYAFERIRAR